jgi:hypothetical protein
MTNNYHEEGVAKFPVIVAHTVIIKCMCVMEVL